MTVAVGATNACRPCRSSLPCHATTRVLGATAQPQEHEKDRRWQQHGRDAGSSGTRHDGHGMTPPQQQRRQDIAKTNVRTYANKCKDDVVHTRQRRRGSIAATGVQFNSHSMTGAAAYCTGSAAAGDATRHGATPTPRTCFDDSEAALARQADAVDGQTDAAQQRTKRRPGRSSPAHSVAPSTMITPTMRKKYFSRTSSLGERCGQ
jgi:hypothetical protein